VSLDRQNHPRNQDVSLQGQELRTDLLCLDLLQYPDTLLHHNTDPKSHDGLTIDICRFGYWNLERCAHPLQPFRSQRFDQLLHLHAFRKVETILKNVSSVYRILQSCSLTSISNLIVAEGTLGVVSYNDRGSVDRFDGTGYRSVTQR
jgi:hypothetical protein